MPINLEDNLRTLKRALKKASKDKKGHFLDLMGLYLITYFGPTPIRKGMKQALNQ
jgi:hypothetical protein